MENRTKTIKLFGKNLKNLNPEDYPEVKDLLKGYETLEEFFVTLREMKTGIMQELQEQNLTTDEDFRKELNFTKTEIDEILLGSEENEDFDKFLSFYMALQKHLLNKAKLFSEERKRISSTMKYTEAIIKKLDEFFSLFANSISAVNKAQLKQGDLSSLKEITDAPILLSKDEKCYIKVDRAELYEDVAVRDTVGGISGFSFRIAKGVSYRIGGFKAKGESHMEKRLIDKGIFYVTNKRYIYDGATKNIDGGLEDIISVEVYTDGIKISRSNKRDEAFVGNANWEYVGTVISGIVKNTRD